MVSFVPPLPGISEGGEKRTLPSVMLMAWPGFNGPQVPVQTAFDWNKVFGNTSVIVPSGL